MTFHIQMAGFTKWITGGLGFVLGGPIGGLIGFVVGALLDMRSERLFLKGNFEETFAPYSNNAATAEGDFKMSLLILIACVIKVDGSAKKTELNVVKRFLVANFGEDGALEALQILKNLLNQDINDVEVAQQISRYMNYSSKLELVHFLLDVVYADGSINQQEQYVIQQISWNLGISSLDLQSLEALYNKQSNVAWAYEVLEITEEATNEEIKKAYRSMAMKYHPDKVANLGEDVKKKATEKFRSVNEAYEYLKEIRQMK